MTIFLNSLTQHSFNFFVPVIGMSSASSLGLTFVFALYTIGLLGLVFNRKNFIISMLAIEIVYLSVVVSFIILDRTVADAQGMIYALVLLITAASESALGLGILIVLFRFGGSIEFGSYESLGG